VFHPVGRAGDVICWMAGATVHGAQTNGPQPRKIAIFKYLSNDIGQNYNSGGNVERARVEASTAVTVSGAVGRTGSKL
jgi:hypothetical protein